MPHFDLPKRDVMNEFEAEGDMRVLMESDRIKADSRRMNRAKDFAMSKRERLTEFIDTVQEKRTNRINGAVQNSKLKFGGSFGS